MSLSDLQAITEPGRYDIRITEGDSLGRVFTLQDSSGDPVPLTGLTGAAEVRDAFGGSLLATLTVVVDQAATGETGVGQVTVSAIGDLVTSALNGVWDLEISDGSPTGIFRKTVVQGTFVVLPQATGA